MLSHLGTMIFAQLAHALSLNDSCDWLRLAAAQVPRHRRFRPHTALAQQPLQLQQRARRSLRRTGLLAHAGASAPTRRELCAGLQDGGVVVFDKAYVDFAHLHDLDLRGVQWVTRAKDNCRYRALRNLPVVKGSSIVKDQIIKLTGAKWKSLSGWTLRRVEAWVEVEGKQRLMVFITNNTDWSPRSVCDLYRARWDIEVFFKQVKQTLKLGDFLGHNAKAIRWQVWTALLVYVLLRSAAHIGQWGQSFTRLFAVVRAAMWERLDMLGVLRSYGTAGGSFKMLGSPLTAWLPGFEPAGTRSHGTASA